VEVAVAAPVLVVELVVVVVALADTYQLLQM
jgi:hypothetical protein